MPDPQKSARCAAPHCVPGVFLYHGIGSDSIVAGWQAHTQLVGEKDCPQGVSKVCAALRALSSEVLSP